MLVMEDKKVVAGVVRACLFADYAGTDLLQGSIVCCLKEILKNEERKCGRRSERGGEKTCESVRVSLQSDILYRTERYWWDQNLLRFLWSAKIAGGRGVEEASNSCGYR